MQAVKGHLLNGWFKPIDEVLLPNCVEAVLVFEEASLNTLPYVFNEAEKQVRIDWLARVEALLELSRDEDLSDFPKQEHMKTLEDYAWFD
jgi:hypothetical protein